MVKWVNRYLIRKGSFWTVKDSSSLSSWMWKKLLKCRDVAAVFSKVTVHNGFSTSFWFDDWSELGCLMNKTGAGGLVNMGIHLHDTVATVLHKHRRRRHRMETYNIIEHEIQSSETGDYIMRKMSDYGIVVILANLGLLLGKLGSYCEALSIGSGACGFSTIRRSSLFTHG